MKPPPKQHRGAGEWLDLQRAVTEALERSQSLTEAGPLILDALMRAEERARGERLLTDAEQAAETGSFELALDTGETHYSPGLHRIFATPTDVELTRELLLERVHPEDRELVEKSFEGAYGTREPLHFEFRVTRFDGAERVVRARGEAVKVSKRGPIKVVGTMQDVTDEAAARSARDLLSYVVQSTRDAIVTKARDGTITSWNRGAEQLYGFSATEAIGQPIGLIEPTHRAGEQQKILQTLLSGESIENFETEGIRKDGSVIAVSLTVSPVTDANGRIVSTAIIARDTTERVRYEERLRHMADHDQLTGLFNRRRFDEQLKRELARAGRYAAHSAVLSIDIDNFKGINDSAGHAAGDAVLVQVARVLGNRFRSTDVVARLGGDEFAVLLSAVGPDEARAAAEDLLAEIRNGPASYGGRPFRISASIGVTAFESDDATAGEVLVNADLAMYAAKTAGRDRVVVYTAPEARKARAMAKLTWSQRIQDALDRDRFVLHLQPILELATGQIKHGELLLRMKGERGKLIAPGAFLPAAERFGLIHAIDRWVVARAIQLIAESMGPIPRVGINLSGESVVGDPELAADDRARARALVRRPLQADLRGHRDGRDRQHARGHRVRPRPDRPRLQPRARRLRHRLRLLLLPQAPAGELREARRRVHPEPAPQRGRRAHGQGDRRRLPGARDQDRRRVGRRRRDDRAAPEAPRRLRPGLLRRQADPAERRDGGRRVAVEPRA